MASEGGAEGGWVECELVEPLEGCLPLVGVRWG